MSYGGGSVQKYHKSKYLEIFQWIYFITGHIIYLDLDTISSTSHNFVLRSLHISKKLGWLEILCQKLRNSQTQIGVNLKI